jgi:hypothetical protein
VYASWKLEDVRGLNDVRDKTRDIGYPIWSSGMGYRVALKVDTNVSEKHAASIFRVGHGYGGSPW